MNILKENKILVITNTIVNSNPALLRMVRDLHQHFDIYIYGKEKDFLIKNEKIHYRTTRPFFLPCKILSILIKPIYFINQHYYHILLKNININMYNWILSKFMPKKFFDLAIYIDTEALSIARHLDIKKNWYFIYEIYHNQLAGTNEKIIQYNKSFESQALNKADILISSGNHVIGSYLVNSFNLQSAQILTYSVCPPQAHKFSDIKDHYQKLKFYYHGALVPNRGLEEAIMAFIDISNAELYIRGFGSLKNQLAGLIHELNLNDRVFILDPVPTEQLTNVASYFDVGLTLVKMNIENHKYGVGFKTFENISAGLALILPASYPLSELNSKFKVGINYEDATVTELKKIFKYFTNNIDMVNVFKRNSRKAYAEYYNPETQKNILISKINQTLSE